MAIRVSIEEVRELMPESATVVTLSPSASYIVVVKRGSLSVGDCRKIASRLALVNIDVVVVQCADVNDTVRVLEIKAAEAGG